MNYQMMYSVYKDSKHYCERPSVDMICYTTKDGRIYLDQYGYESQEIERSTLIHYCPMCGKKGEF